MVLGSRLYSLFDSIIKAEPETVTMVEGIDIGDEETHDLYLISAAVEGTIEKYTIEDYDDGYVVIYDSRDNPLWTGYL